MAASTAVAAPALTSFRADIDGLRALSILLVVAFHAGLDRFGGGYVGVDVFFVLSGYLITGLLIREQQNTGRIGLLDFYARRARRLLPLAALVLLSTLLAGLALLPPLLRAGLLADVRASALYFANWRYASQTTAYSDAEVTDTLLLHYWSLSVEEQFYVLWPLLIMLAASLARRRRSDLFVPVLSTLLSVVIVASLWVSITSTSELGPSSYYATHTRLWEMGAGAALAIVLPRVPNVSRLPTQALAALGITLILLSALIYDTATPFPGWAALLPVSGTMLLIATAAEGETAVSRFLASGPLPTLGRWSYAWYLWHWPAIGVAALLNERLGAPWSETVVVGTAVVFSLLLAGASHHLIENPVRHARFFRVGFARSLMLGLSLTLIPVAVAASYNLFGNVGDTRLSGAGPDEGGDEPPADGSGPEGHDDVASQSSNGVPDVPMSPADAAADVVTVAQSSCNSSLEDSEVDASCVFGDPEGTRTVVLLGDSHAQHWLPALDAAGREKGWKVISWTKSSCPPFDIAVYEPRIEGRFVHCEAWRDSVEDEISARGDIDLVVIGRSYGYLGLVIEEDGDRVEDRAEIRRRWRRGAEQSLDSYTSHGAEVLVIRDTPWAPSDVPTCVSEHVERPHRCDFSLDADTAARDRLLYEEEARAGGASVEFWDATRAVCPTDPCSVVAGDGVIIYRDSHHLTQTYSRMLADRIATPIEDILGRSREDGSAAHRSTWPPRPPETKASEQGQKSRHVRERT